MSIAFAAKRAFVRNLLNTYDIPYEHWGKGNAKDLDDLVAEVAAGETILRPVGYTLKRLVSVLYIDVRYWSRLLREDRQEFIDGRVRRRTNLQGSMAEKLQSGERASPRAVERAIEEELGIPAEGLFSITRLQSWQEEMDSPSYPGLPAELSCYRFSVQIRDEWYSEEGYVEMQPKKSTYFVWH